MVEKNLADYDRAYGLKSVALRYFNVAGAGAETRIGERHAIKRDSRGQYSFVLSEKDKIHWYIIKQLVLLNKIYFRKLLIPIIVNINSLKE